MSNFEVTSKQFDLIIIGGGGSGLMAAISAFDSGIKNIAVISKVHPINSHTVAAKGGINAALGNVAEDDWRWHAFDTIKGSDYLADKNAVDILCSNASDAILELEKMGVVFSRDDNGKIAQRAYGGQTINFGKNGIAHRACYAKDKTGQTILHTLYSEALSRNIKFFNEFFVTDLLIDDSDVKSCGGCVTIDLNNGKIDIFFSSQTIIATGGYSQIYRNTTSSTICTGDGTALVMKENLPLQDMEFVQFHPTGIFAQGFLISEAARSEGAYLLNANNERFMENYAPQMMELASRDIISRAIAFEIAQGRGCGINKNFIHLDLRHLSDQVLRNKLPGVVETAKNFAKVDVKKDLIPVVPTAHYTMGGIPTNIDCEVLDENLQNVNNLMAVGEAACVSVHGANRLGCNSLLDLIVFGKIAGKKSAENLQKKHNGNYQEINYSKIVDKKIADLEKIFLSPEIKANYSKGKTNNLSRIKIELQNINELHLSVFRDENLLKQGLLQINKLFKVFQEYRVENRLLLWNEELTEYFEIRNLFLNSFAALYSAMWRKESRGAHYRNDYNQKDDKNYLYHTISIINFDDDNFENKIKIIKKDINL